MANNNHLYSDLEAKLDTLIGRTDEDSLSKYDYWRSLKMAKVEFETLLKEQHIEFGIVEFTEWLEETYGIRIGLVDQMIGQTSEVVDEKKYLFFKLKYS